MKDTRLIAATSLLVLASPLAPRVAAEKERAWIEVQTPHFTVVTEAGAGAARRTARRFERIRGALAEALPRAATAPPAFTIVLARDEDSMRSLVPEWWERRGGLRPASVALGDPHYPAVVLRDDLYESDQEQERYVQAYWGYAAHLVSHNAPSLPLWAQRGLTEFYAHTSVHEDRILIGRAAPNNVQTLKRIGMMPTARLLAVDRGSPEYLEAAKLERFDAQSWLLVHYLMLGDKGSRRPLMGQLFARSASGARAEQAALEVLGDPGALDRALEVYLHSKGFYMETHPAMGSQAVETSAERPLGPAGLHTLRGLVHLASRRVDDARRELEAALRIEPAFARAHEALAVLAWRRRDESAARKAAGRALELAPDLPVAREIAEQLGGPPGFSAARRRCEAGDPAACVTAGDWLLSGQVPDADAAQGAALLEKACAGGVADACTTLASRLRSGSGVPADKQRAADLSEKACLLGALQDCLAVANDLETGEDVPRDAARAARLYETACDRGERVGCTALAWALQSGEHMAKDVARAVSLYEKACGLKDATACVQAGILVFGGDGVAKDLPRAARAFEAGCATGEAAGCANLGTLHKAGLGVPRDPVKARALFEKACQSGYQTACAELKAAAARRPASRR